VITRLRLRNFKRFDDLDLELGGTVVLIGPNNSGKTSALQALALWELGLRSWVDRRGDGAAPKSRPGVTMNRKDLVSVPVPDAALLWRGQRYSRSHRVNGKAKTLPVHLEVVVDGVDAEVAWSCGFEFDHANEESIRCRPIADDDEGERRAVPDAARTVRMALLPPMAGLASQEPRIDIGAIQVRIGEGRTSEVLRNLCYLVHQLEGAQWQRVHARLDNLFGVDLEPPTYLPARGEIGLAYREPDGTRLDISSAGRGMQQTLLLLTYLEANPGSVLLLDEPDAHLEILRQRQIYHELVAAAEGVGSQIIAASHSEVWLNEAADRDVVVAFVGAPHRIDDRSGRAQVVKSLKSIGFEQYYQAERRGWVLYLEGSTDLAILRAFAAVLEHPAAVPLQAPFVQYVGNQEQDARHHFFGLREAKSDLVGIAIFDSDQVPKDHPGLRELAWTRREIENYLCQPETLVAFAGQHAAGVAAGPLFEATERLRVEDAMRTAIRGRVPPVVLDRRDDPWWHRMKATDDFLDRVFEDFYAALRLPNLMRKSDYHRLAPLVARESLDPEIRLKLDAIVEVAGLAQPRE
jgi:ABC-type taurine transport system ATPase subunit